MLLDLFITHWTEDWSVGEKGFRMLSMQREVDWSQIRITMVHDGTEPFPEKYFKGMPFTVNQVSVPHGGIAAARNWCIDHSEAEWIKWCDFDDMFEGVYSLKIIMDALNSDRYDMIWFELLFDDHGKIINRTNRDPVFVHNKVFRRSFLQRKNIRFNEELTWCEDSAFLAVVEMDIDKLRIHKIRSFIPIYVYIVRDGSLCNKPEIRFANLESFFRRHCYVAEEYRKRNRYDDYCQMCVRTIADSYYTLVKAPGITEDKSGLEKRVWEWYRENRQAIRDCKRPQRELVMKAVNKERFDGGKITWEEIQEWIEGKEEAHETDNTGRILRWS